MNAGDDASVEVLSETCALIEVRSDLINLLNKEVAQSGSCQGLILKIWENRDGGVLSKQSIHNGEDFTWVGLSQLHLHLNM